MTEERHALTDPKAVLAEPGFTVLDGLDVKVVENGDDGVHMLPGKPPSPASVSDAVLGHAAGGKTCSTTVVHRCVLVCD